MIWSVSTLDRRSGTAVPVDDALPADNAAALLKRNAADADAQAFVDARVKEGSDYIKLIVEAPVHTIETNVGATESVLAAAAMKPGPQKAQITSNLNQGHRRHR